MQVIQKIDHFANYFASQSLLTSSQQWLGRVVQWLRSPETLKLAGQTCDVVFRTIAIYAADVVLFQLVYRIAHFINPQANNIQIKNDVIDMNFSLYTLAGYTLGAVAISYAVLTPLSAISRVIVGIMAAILGAFNSINWGDRIGGFYPVIEDNKDAKIEPAT